MCLLFKLGRQQQQLGSPLQRMTNWRLILLNECSCWDNSLTCYLTLAIFHDKTRVDICLPVCSTDVCIQAPCTLSTLKKYYLKYNQILSDQKKNQRRHNLKPFASKVVKQKALINRLSMRKRDMVSNPLFMIPDFFLHFTNELS